MYSNDRYLRKTFLNGTRIEDLRVSTGSLRGVDFDARYAISSDELVITLAYTVLPQHYKPPPLFGS